VAGIVRDIEPRDPEVVKQAVNYATCNPKRLLLFG
jgi:hypothetical protein